ncbi:DUF898 family protein [Inquilinus sp. CAU 1745]|uniref:YjgN family protein n=1 Tax=Inquilinus sp. CAU 1745 TaxID=3140369 RepID=UPI00325BA626
MTDATFDAVSAAPPEDTAGSVIFTAYRGPLAKLAVKTVLLSIVTLGFYRFWGKTAIRRFLWGNISIAGDRLEYTGTAKELLIGFLIAIVLLAPLFAMPYVLGYLVADETLLGLLGSLNTMVLLFLVQVAIYRARRYKLSRTQWRGVRFDQSGRALDYARMAMVSAGVVMITLGLAYPWQRVRLQRYRTGNTWFGDERASLEATATRLMPTWLIVWGLAVATVILSILLTDIHQNGDDWLGGQSILTLACGLGTTIAFVRYHVVEFRYFVESTRFLNLRVTSRLASYKIVFIYAMSPILYIITISICAVILFRVDYWFNPGAIPTKSEMLLLVISWGLSVLGGYFVVSLVWV